MRYRHQTLQQLNQNDDNALLMMVTQLDGESNDNYEHCLKLIRNQINQHDGHTSSDVNHYKWFVMKNSSQHPAVNQTSPQRDHEALTAQLEDVSAPKKIRIIRA